MNQRLEIKRVSTGYAPRPLQLEIHLAKQRFKVLNLHRRFGKTVLVINEQVDFLLKCKHKNPHGVYLAPTYGQAKRVAWDYYKEYCKNLPNVEFKEGELKIVIPRENDKISIWLLGAENPDSARGMYIDHAILDEYADMSPIVWDQILRPALSDRKGNAIFIGTPKGQNHFYKMYQDAVRLQDEGESWYARTITVDESGYVDSSELREAKLTMSEDSYNQEYLCSFTAALTGAYYSKYMQELLDKGQICKVPYERSIPVTTAWDLGMSDSTTIWFMQKVGREIHLIDYICEAGRGLEWYVLELQKRGYIYGEHILPHDAAARELGTGKTRQEALRDFGLARTTIIPRQNVADGIHAVRQILPRCWFDLARCGRGIDALKAYQRKFDAKNDTYLDKPLHDWASHGADAFRYLALGFSEYSIDTKELPRTADSSYNELSDY